MRITQILSVSLPPEMVKQAEKLAKKENRTKSELIREALRRYIQQAQWQQIRSYGQVKARALGLKETDVERLIQDYRAQKRSKASPKKRG